MSNHNNSNVDANSKQTMDVDNKPTSSSSLPGEQETPFGLNPKRIEQLRDRLNQEKAMLERLPSTSSYAIHRLRVVRRALEILQDARNNETTAQEMSELDKLLSGLSLSS